MSTRTQRRSRQSRSAMMRVISIFLAMLIVGGTLASLLQLF